MVEGSGFRVHLGDSTGVVLVGGEASTLLFSCGFPKRALHLYIREYS